MKCTIVSLGCPKNLVDSEEIIGTLGAAGCEIAVHPEEADVVIINTCGFILPAFEETCEEIRRVKTIADNTGGQVYVYGCAVERFEQDLRRRFPKIDHWYRIAQQQDMIQAIHKNAEAITSRLVTTPGYAYLRIADGCSNQCAYCTIPDIRGAFRSVPEHKILQQARELVDLGIKELIFVAQDTTRYGEDLYGTPMLIQLLRKCSEIPGISWIRLLYAHPRGITEQLLNEIQSNDKICNYLDIPIQHNNDRLLEKMNRNTCRNHIETIFKRCGEIKGFSLRTTVIAGLPTETDKEFTELITFLRHANITRLGVFKYYKEEHTRAAAMPQVDNDCIEDRYNQLLDLQYTLLQEYYQRELGMTRKILIHGRNGLYCGHSEYSCPEIDDPIMIQGQQPLDFGRFYEARMIQVDQEYLYGEVTR